MPSPTYPQWLTDLNHIASSKQRAFVLAWIVENPGTYTGQILEGTGVDRTALSRLLRELENYELITGDVPMGDRRGRTVRYSPNRRKLAAAMKNTAAAFAPPPA